MRPSWHEYFMGVAKLAASRSTCPRAQVGCVLVLDRQIISTGYNGSVPNMPHCTEVGCLTLDGHCVRTIHAEMNAIGQAARRGASVGGATAYVTHTPCVNCQKSLAASGVVSVITGQDYGSHAKLSYEVTGLSVTGLERT